MKTTSKSLSKSKSNTPANAYLVSDSTKKKIEKLHYDILTNQLKGFEKAVELGAILSDIKEKLPHGKFIPWIEENFKTIKMRTVQYYMKFYHNQDRLRLELHDNLSIVDAKKFMEKPKKNSSDMIPAATQKEINKSLEKTQNRIDNSTLQKLVKGKIDSMPMEQVQRILPKKLTRLERLTATMERIKKEIEVLTSQNQIRP